MENTLVILKPDGVNKKLLLKVIKRFINKGLIVSNLKGMVLDKHILHEHYNHLIEHPFYKELEEFMLSSIVVVMIVTGENAVFKVREIVGATDPKKAVPESIRGEFGDHEVMMKNIVHASDTVENALIEIKRFYQDEDVINNRDDFVYQKRKERKYAKI